MKEQPFTLPSLRPDQTCLEVAEVSFLANGPYSFSLLADDCLGLSGSSGVGKTQFLPAIADLIPHTGTVRLHGVSSEDVPAPQWRCMIGMVPADPRRWHDLVGPHFAQGTESDAFVSTLTRLGFGTEVLGWQVSRLSTGERQRLALVRALVLKPDVLLLDEPSSGLDSFHAGLLEAVIAEVRSTRNTAVVWVSHDLEQLERVATRVMKVEQHRLLSLELA